MDMYKVIHHYLTNRCDMRAGEQVLISYDRETDPVVVQAFDVVSRAIGAEVTLMRTRIPDSVGAVDPPDVVAEAYKHADIVVELNFPGWFYSIRIEGLAGKPHGRWTEEG